MKNLIQYCLLYVLIMSFVSCGTEYKLPKGNAETINSERNEFAPVQVPSYDYFPDFCTREFQFKSDGDEMGTKASYIVLEEMLGNKYAENVDALVFTGSNSGFFSVSHPPDTLFASKKILPFSGNIGGTELFEFYSENGKPVTKNLGEPINTNTWDSHPFALANEKGDVFLIWSSDRQDNMGGCSSPFLNAKNISGNEDTLSGNSDLYYAFKINGKWTAPRNLNDANKYFNTLYSEETPFVYCMCFNSILLFASNRNNKNLNDFDIYYSEIRVNFETQKIDFLSDPKTVSEKGNDKINSYGKEFFPYIAMPLPENDSIPVKLYLSSDRYKNKPETGAPAFKNKGGFDIYKFDFDKRCRPPRVEYYVHILDKSNPEKELPGGTMIELTDARGRNISSSNSNPAHFSLSYTGKYLSKGKVFYNAIQCNGLDSVIQNYVFTDIIKKPPTVKATELKIPFDSIIAGKKIILFDTTAKTMFYKQQDIGAMQTSPSRIIKKIEFIGDSLKVDMLEVKSREEILNPRVVTKYRTEIKLDTIISFDTIVHKSYIDFSISEKSKRGYFPEFVSDRDTEIHDTIFVEPEYYVFPPCKWEFTSIVDNYRKNVPFFQTGFWEVNTSKNLERQINELRSRKFAGASPIELQPENQYFGYRRNGLTDEQQEMKRRRWENRVAEYRQFAKIVDRNLNDMADEIAESVLPRFMTLDSLIPNSGNKVIIQIEGYSDFRDLIGGKFIANEDVNYISGSYNESKNQIDSLKIVSIKANQILDQKNDTLSKLRAYFGYKELKDRLLKNITFNKWYDRGDILFCDEADNMSKFNEKFKTAKVILFAVGKRFDNKSTAEVQGYKREPGDYYGLDSVRRINVIINRIQYQNGQIMNTECCRPMEKLVKEYSKLSEPIQTVSDNSMKTDVINSDNLSNSNDENSSITPEDEIIEYIISFGVFENEQNAEKLVEKLKLLNIGYIGKEKVTLDGKLMTRVVSDSYFSKETADEKSEEFGKRFKNAKIDIKPIVITK